MDFVVGRFFSPCRNYKPHPHGIALGRLLALAEITNPTQTHFALGRFFRPWAGITNPNRMELDLSLAEITNPAGVELHLEDFEPLRKLQTPTGWNWTWKTSSACGNYKPHMDGIRTWKIF